ncbi:unnamed protein product [Cylicocyclus nassatus]|uniref:BTB domain-containing protein n=1 Tax=Cylicocyclus nassatus TaxID=53992 RepID=A0AA36M5S3_CYLNA|nr:unnamed protein product [Cylicocyclus nassatus]
MAEEQKLSTSDKRMKINVGGTIFETYLSTLRKVKNSVLSAMVAEHWRNEEEMFVDRDPNLFVKVLDYLRDEKNFVPPSDDDVREALGREADFYYLPGLVKLCSPTIFCVDDVVKWKDSAIESYWKAFAIYIHDQGGCIACSEHSLLWKSVIPPMDTLNFEYYTPLKHHMRFMKGVVTAASYPCCCVQWDYRQHLDALHIPQSALRLAE